MFGLRVVEAHTPALRRAFIELPYRLYRHDPAWVAPLRRQARRQIDPTKNPFSSHGSFQPMVALRGPRVVGRVVALDDRAYNQFHNAHDGFFGLLEVEDDPEAVAALLEAAADWCRTRGAERLLGPMNFSTNGDCGLLVEGFGEPPMVNLAYTAPTYPELVERCGLRKAWDYLAYRLPLNPLESSAGSLTLAEEVRRSRRVELRYINPRRYHEEMDRLLALYNQAWASTVGFVPLSAAEARAAARGLRPLLSPEQVLLAEVDRALVGFCLAVPDINQALRPLRGRLLGPGLVRGLRALSQLRGLRLCALGVLPDYAATGLPALLCLEALAAARRLGYSRVELSLVPESNETLRSVLETLGAVPSKRWRIYERIIQ
ncbi:MAG: N-acetyltransferase [Myxococcales bacterium]|nr:N-acetyltransferase [Myxococcota bacterium]MDW8283580.1 N-acetyltransferase [Myxococcales bacterium]